MRTLLEMATIETCCRNRRDLLPVPEIDDGMCMDAKQISPYLLNLIPEYDSPPPHWMTVLRDANRKSRWKQEWASEHCGVASSELTGRNLQADTLLKL
ncbi:hypothetical protein CEXT_250901 [Caerostris extrusa]|uniref:Uncharacterized protein n=1 Tax=Caerostris extrusa TaxID=172846 RepID=A0AAV4T9U3_CAEEX|nr:hypothetical protein CEXT_250901 [Caerostris extrusa]